MEEPVKDIDAVNSTSESKSDADLKNEMKRRLKKYIKKLDETKVSITPEESEKLECDTFKQLYKPKLEGSIESYKVVPKFYFKLPRPNEPLAQKLRYETRLQFLRKKTEELLDDKELTKLRSLLHISNNYSMSNCDDKIIDYNEYKKLRNEAGPKYRPYFTTEVFGRLQAAEGGTGRIRAGNLYNYIARRVWLQQSRIGLAIYDVAGQGYLTENNLENYIEELVPTLAALNRLEPSFSTFYKCTAARKFLFFLDPLRIGRVRIRDMLSSSFLEDLTELRKENLPMEVQDQNWFSARSALRVYAQFLNLDKNCNGLLSINELADYGSGTLTRAFLQRVYQQCTTYNNEMDYKTYLDFVLAMENRAEPAALAYLFRVLDIKEQGYLDAFTLNFFFKAIQKQVLAHDGEFVNFDDVKDEIFDMVRPEHPAKITLKDLVRSGHGHTALSILMELHCFWAYESKQSGGC